MVEVPKRSGLSLGINSSATLCHVYKKSQQQFLLQLEAVAPAAMTDIVVPGWFQVEMCIMT